MWLATMFYLPCRRRNGATNSFVYNGRDCDLGDATSSWSLDRRACGRVRSVVRKAVFFFHFDNPVVIFDYYY